MPQKRDFLLRSNVSFSPTYLDLRKRASEDRYFHTNWSLNICHIWLSIVRIHVDSLRWRSISRCCSQCCSSHHFDTIWRSSVEECLSATGILSLLLRWISSTERSPLAEGVQIDRQIIEHRRSSRWNPKAQVEIPRTSDRKECIHLDLDRFEDSSRSNFAYQLCSFLSSIVDLIERGLLQTGP